MSIVHYKSDVAIITHQPIVIARENDVKPALDAHAAIFQTDGKDIGKGLALAWVARDATGTGQAIGKLVLEIVDPIPGQLKSKLSWWLIAPSGGLLKVWELFSDGTVIGGGGGGGGPLPANVALLDAIQTWTAEQTYNSPCKWNGPVNFSEPVLISRTGTGGSPGVPALDTHCAIWVTDGDQPGQGSSQAWVAKDNTGTPQAICKQVVEMVNTTPGQLKVKLAWWLVTPTSGLWKVWELDSEGALQSAYTRVGAGDPNGVIFAPTGAVYHRTDGGAGTSFYVKESAAALNTGWAAK